MSIYLPWLPLAALLIGHTLCSAWRNRRRRNRYVTRWPQGQCHASYWSSPRRVTPEPN